MKEEIKNTIKIAYIYVSAIIGAGFASGQEIIKFFTSYYKGGFYGIILAGIMFSVIGSIVLVKIYDERIVNYDEFIFPTVGRIAGRFMGIIVLLFMLSLFSIMVAGMGSIISEKLGISYQFSTVIMSCICMFIILGDIKRVIAFSSIITPLLTVGMVIMGLYIIVSKDIAVFNIAGASLKRGTDNWIVSSLLYVSYNSILSVVVMCNILPYLKTRKSAKWGGVLGGLMLCFIVLIINSTINLFYPQSITGEMPMLDIVGRYSKILGYVYTVVLWLAMLVSAVNSGFCLAERVSSMAKIDMKIITVASCVLVVPLSGLGFSGLISSIYPVFGFIGLLMVSAILFQGLKKCLGQRVWRKNKKNKSKNITV